MSPARSPMRQLAALAMLLGLCLPLPATAQQSAPGAAAAYSSAAALQDRGVYDLAVKEWQKLLAEFPDDPLAARAGYNLGVCRFQSGDFAAAAEAFQQATSAPGADEVADSSWANLGLARFNLAASLPEGQTQQASLAYQQAIAAFDKLLADFRDSPQAPNAQYYRAESLTALGQHAQAAEGYREVLASDAAKPLHANARLGLASAELEAGQPSQAAAALDPLIASNPTGEIAGEAFRLRGEARLAASKFAEAAVDFGCAAQVKDYSAAADSLERRGFALYSAKQYGQAAVAYQQLAKQFPKSGPDAGAWLAAGKCLLLAGQRDQAADLLGRMWNADPTAANAEAAHWLVQTLFEAKKYPEAATAAQQALRTKPDERWAAPLRMTLADSLFELPNQRERALNAYQAIARGAPDSPQGKHAGYLAAHTALEIEQNALALRLATEYLKRNPQSELIPDARLVAAESAMRLAQPHEAAVQFQALLRDSSTDERASDWSLRLASLQRAEGDWTAVINTLGPRIHSLKQDRLERGLVLLAEAQQKNGDNQAADATLSRLISTSRDPSRLAPALYQRGELRAAEGKMREANADFAKLANTHPQHELAPFALYALASNQLAAGAKGDAEQTLKQLITQHKTGPIGKAHYLLAGLLQESGRHAEALEQLEQAEAPAPELLYRKALALAASGDKAQAQQSYQTLLREHADHELADRALFELAWLVNDSDQARATTLFAKLASDYPGSPLVGEALLRVGESQYEKQAFRQAAQTLARAAEAKSASPDVRSKALHFLGWSQFEQQDHAAALDAFKRQLAINNQGSLAADAAAMVGECQYALKQWDQALTAYQPTTTNPPGNQQLAALAWLHAGQAAGQLGKWEESLAWINRASQADSDGEPVAEVTYERGWALYNLRRMDQAQPIFEKLAAAGPNVLAARSQFLLGEIEFANKQYEAAVRTFFRVAYGYGGREAPEEYHTWQAESLFEAARCLELLERREPARKLYAELLERFPDSPKARQARSRLQPAALR